MSIEGDEDTSPFLCGVETPLKIQYDWQSNHLLSTIVVQKMIEAAGVDPTDVPESFYKSIDPDALEDLFRPQMDGTPRKKGKISFSFAGHYITVRSDGQIIVESELGRLKRTGGNILLTGDVPEDVINRISARLLGEPAYDRTQLFAHYGQDMETAQTRLELAQAAPEHAYLLTHEGAARSVAQAKGGQSNQMSISPVIGTLDGFQTAIRERVIELQRRRNGFDPAELRFCFDSLRLLVEEEGRDTAIEFLISVTDAIEDVGGLGHYILPHAYGSRPVQSVQSSFDAVIDLKIGVNGPEQRWHLHDTDHTTQWFPL